MQKTIFEILDSRHNRPNDFKCDRNTVLDIEQNIKNFEEFEKEIKRLQKCKTDTTEIARQKTQFKKEIDNFIRNLKNLFCEQSKIYMNRLCDISQRIVASNIALVNQVGLFHDFFLFVRILEAFNEQRQKKNRPSHNIVGDIDLSFQEDDCKNILDCMNVDEDGILKKVINSLDFVELDLSCFDIEDAKKKTMMYNYLQHKMNDTEKVAQNYFIYKEKLSESKIEHTQHKTLDNITKDFFKKITNKEKSLSFFSNRVSSFYLYKLMKQEKRVICALAYFLGILKFKKYLQSIVFCECLCYELDNDEIFEKDEVRHVKVYQRMTLSEAIRFFTDFAVNDVAVHRDITKHFRHGAALYVKSGNKSPEVENAFKYLKDKLNSAEGLSKDYDTDPNFKPSVEKFVKDHFKENMSYYLNIPFNIHYDPADQKNKCFYSDFYPDNPEHKLINSVQIRDHKSQSEIDKIMEDNQKTLKQRIKCCLLKHFDLET
jgi:hypothetical protein